MTVAVINQAGVRPVIRLISLIPLLALCFPWNSALADSVNPDDLASCPASTIGETLPPLQSAGSDTSIQADSSSGTLTEWLLQGNVQIDKSGKRLLADQVTYFSETGRAIAQGNVILQQPDLTLRGDSGEIMINGHTGEMRNSRYELPSRAAWGTADSIYVLDPKHTRLENITYTTCLPTKKDWELQAGEIVLDHEKGVGVVRKAVLRFKDVPVFYTPYMSFSLDDQRKSGFLVPSLGYTDINGTIVAAPYYWNIAPNRDATITPRYYSNRGAQLGLEYRYLNENGKGLLVTEYLPDDDLTNDGRGIFSYQHNSRYANDWSLQANLNHASDKDYFKDLGGNLALSSITNLEQRVDLAWSKDTWRFRTRLQAFQPMGETSESYRRLPQLLLDGTPEGKVDGLEFPIHAELVRFDHENDVTTGNRFDLYPAVRYDYRQPGYFVTPKAGLRYTRYDTEDPSNTLPDSKTRTLPVFSMDSGLFFERNDQFAGRKVVHSLEPRMFYLYVPNRNQDTLPVYDTGRYTFSFAQMFRENRFTGADRVGDANQLTLALTHRSLDTNTGDEIFRVGLGQVLYFRDREVTLPNQVAGTRSSSEMIAEIGAHFGQYTSANAAIQWDPDQEETSRSSARLQFRSDNQHILNLSYRYEKEDFEQTDLSFIWPISRQWTGIGRWNYALDDQRTQGLLIGVQYETCCWLFRVLGRSYILSEEEDRTQSVLLQLQFKGLGNFGNKIDELLERTIFGYRRGESVQ